MSCEGVRPGRAAASGCWRREKSRSRWRREPALRAGQPTPLSFPQEIEGPDRRTRIASFRRGMRVEQSALMPRECVEGVTGREYEVQGHGPSV